jgi:hypothetical protein
MSERALSELRKDIYASICVLTVALLIGMAVAQWM